MSKAVPWSIKGVDFDARDAAKEAARRDGLSLGEWLNRAIADHAAETGADDQEFDADERLEAVAAQLARLSREAETDTRKPRAARGQAERIQPDRDQDERFDEKLQAGSAPPRAAQWDEESEPESEPRRAAAPGRSRQPRERARQVSAREGGARENVDAEALLEKAVAAFESRAERAEARAARALAQVADRVAERIDSAESERADMLAQVENRLADLETHLRTKVRLDVEPLRGALGRLETRLEDLASREPEPRDDETLRKLDRKLSNLISRVERAETAPADERDEQFSRLEKRFDALLARLDRPAPSRAAPPRQEPPPAARAADMRRAIEEISAHQRALDAASSHPQPAPLRPQPAPERPVAPQPAPRAQPAPAFDERFDVLAQKLDRIVQLNAAPSEDRRIDRLQNGIESLSSRIEDMRRDFSALQGAPRDTVAPVVEKALRDLAVRIDTLAAAQPVAALKEVAGLRGELSGLTRGLSDLAPRGAVVALESAMRDLSKRVETTRSTVERVAETRVAPDTPDLSRQLADIARGLHDVAPRGAVAGVESAMRELSNRVESAREIMARASERHLDSTPDFESLNRQLADICAALGDVAPRGAVAGVETAVRDLADRIDSTREIMSRASERHIDFTPDFESLKRQMAEIGAALSDVAPRGAVAGVETAVRDLSARVDSARAFMERAPLGASADEIDALGQQVAAMSRALEDVAPRSQIAALDLAVRELGARVERSRDEGLRDAVLSPIENLAADMRRALAEIGASANIDGVVRQMRALEEKIDGLRRNGADRGDFLNACDQSDALRASIAQALERMAPLERMEQQVASLTERLEGLSRQSNEVSRAHETGLARNEANWRDVGSRLDELALRIDRANDQVPHVGEARAFEELSSRLDFMQQALAERIDGAVVAGRSPQAPQSLEPLLRALADKLENAMAPQADSRAIEALERQMAEVAERLERGAAHGEMQLQQALADLAARLDQGRETAREVARETLREAMAQLPAANALPEQAVREIADLREKHEHSDRRAQQTLSAVHETLERVVDRLAMLEEDVQEARAVAPAVATEPVPPRAPALQNAPPRQNAPSRMNARAEPTTPDFDPDSFLVEPGAGRPTPAAPARAEAPAESDEDQAAPSVKLSREDEAALMSGSQSSNYIEVARRALAARAVAEAQEKTSAGERARGVGAAAERAKEKFMRPRASGEKRGAGARTGVLLAAGASVLALGMLQVYRVALSPVAPQVESATPAKLDAPAAEAQTPQSTPQPAPAAAAPALAPTP
ncbi:hypothetical protein CCR94_00035, partial [Rhodoblastus sphagnicola]